MYNIQNEHQDNIFHVIDLKSLKSDQKKNWSLNTLDYFCFFFSTSDLHFRVQGIEYKILKNSIAFIKPSTQISMLTSSNFSGTLYLLAFSNSFCMSYSDKSLLDKLNHFLNFSLPILILPSTLYLQEISKIIIKKLILLNNSKNTQLYQQIFHNCVELYIIEVIRALSDNSKIKKSYLFPLS